MKIKFLALFLLFAGVSDFSANAQWTVNMYNASPYTGTGVNYFCQSTSPIIRVRNGATDESTSCYVYASTNNLLYGVTGATGEPEGYLLFGPSCAGYSDALTTSNVNSGAVTLYVYPLSGCGVGPDPVCSLTVYILPYGNVGTINGSATIGSASPVSLSTTYSLNTSGIPGYFPTQLTWGLDNGGSHCYFSAPSYTGSTLTVSPSSTLAPVIGGGEITGTYTVGCGTSPAPTTIAGRVPNITSSGSVACGPITLTSNIGDNGATATQLGTALYARDVKLTRQWYLNGTAIPGATGISYLITSTTGGNYSVGVTQYANAGGAWSTTPTNTTPVFSNTIAIAADPGTTPPSFKINGSSPGSSTATAPTVYDCSGSATFVPSNLSSLISSWSLVIAPVSGTSHTITGTGTPPASINIGSSTYLPTSQDYYLTFTTTNACHTESSSGYINLVIPTSVPTPFTVDGALGTPSATGAPNVFACPTIFLSSSLFGSSAGIISWSVNAGTSLTTETSVSSGGSTLPSSLDLSSVVNAAGTWVVTLITNTACMSFVKNEYFTVWKPTGSVSGSFNLGGALPGTVSSPTNISVCPPFDFNPTSSGPIYSYSVTVDGTVSTVVASGTASLPTYATPSAFDISSYLSTGAQSVTFTLSNGCSSSDVSTTGFYNANVGTPTTPDISVVADYYDATGAETFPSYTVSQGNTWDSPILVGYNNTTFTYNDPAAVTSYVASLYTVDPTTGAQTLVWPVSPVTSPTVTGPFTAINYSIGSLDNRPPVGSYIEHAGTGKEYYAKFALSNSCGTVVNDGKYFTIAEWDGTSGYWRQSNTNSTITTAGDNTTISFTPLPFTNQLTAHISLQDAASTTLTILTVDGRIITTAWENEAMDKGTVNKTINTENWTPGLYFYRFTSNGKTYTGKLVKN